MTRVAVIGAGGFGTALALTLNENGHQVRLWGHDAQNISRLKSERENAKYLPGVPLPEKVLITDDPSEALDGTTFLISAIPTRHLRSVFSSIHSAIPSGISVLSTTKGIEPDSLKRPSQVIREFLPRRTVAILTGPSHAEEVARRVPTSVVIASNDRDLARSLQRLFTTERFRVYAQNDPLGAELGGALKNVIALAAGICDGLGFGDNTKSALVTRGLVEIVRLATRLGARKHTFAGLAGIGDLITTSFSPHGRNRFVGERLGQGQPLDRILRETDKVAEGVETSRAVMTLARRHRVDMPIAREVHAVIFEGKSALSALSDLMKRSSKTEVW